MHTMKQNILVIDDEPLVAEMFAYILRDAGYRVKTALSASEAIDIFKQSRIDMLVSDVQLGEIDGFDVAGMLRRQQPLLPVVLITGRPEVEASRRAACLGYRYLSKPVPLGQFVGVVESCLQRRTLLLRDAA